MRPFTLTTTVAAATSGAGPVDVYLGPMNLGLEVVVTDATGTPSCKVQYTMDDPFGASQTWFDHATLTAVTTSGAGSILFPVTAVRLGMASGSGAAAARLRVVQSGAVS